MSDRLCFLASLVSRTPTTEVRYLGLHIHRVKEENETETEPLGWRLGLSVSKKKKKRKKRESVYFDGGFYQGRKDRSESVLPRWKYTPRKKDRSEVFYQGEKLEPMCFTKEES
jgi:hypothetical protein